MEAECIVFLLRLGIARVEQAFRGVFMELTGFHLFFSFALVLLFYFIYELKQLSERVKILEKGLQHPEHPLLGGSSVICLQIQDPLKVAQNYSSYAKVAQVISSEWIERKVYEKVQEELEKAFQEHQVPIHIHTYHF
jgi:hypothetical protein